MEEDEEDRGYITQKDFMNDFMTEDFLNKNIRVRPLSGVSRGDDGKTNDVHNKSLNNDQFASVIKFMQDSPVITYDIKYKCRECGTDNVKTLKGLSDFFS